MTTTMIRKDFWAVRAGEKFATIRLVTVTLGETVSKVWKVDSLDTAAVHVTFTDRPAAMAAAATMVAA